ncbi:PTS sugar transporter subunit IIA, partial [Microbacteriaceae bacterium K1510]|nr:PTS sugar transporter subunit IIA [Frankia sp. Cpl3]MCK9911750.1 PTS sugar transporter subunit IIA [Microbacteriaceae bacterium K1510]
MMIHILRTLGPYVIIAPGVALPHARPEHGVISTGISVVRFAQPVAFAPGPESQVTVMICLAAIDSSSHLGYLQTIADIIS